MPSISKLATRIRDGRATAEGLVEQCLSVIADRDREINAFISVLDDEARARARQADREIAGGRDLGLLHGIPLSVKDLLDLRGFPTTAASRVRTGHCATADAEVVARLRSAGVVFIGKCNLHEFAFGTTGEESAFGPTRNPHALGHVAGGSSGGSAASVAGGMAVGSVGTDTGGSIRIPAAACGVVGLKPTFGELSCEGIVPLSPTLDHVGPLGATVDDVATMYRAMAGHVVAVGEGPIGMRGADDRPPARLALVRPYFLDVLDDQVRQVFERAMDHLRGGGYTISEVAIPKAEAIAATYRNTVLYEALRVHGPTLESRARNYSPGVRQRLEMGRTVSTGDYGRAQQSRERLRREVDVGLEGVSALVLPTLPIPAPPLGTHSLDVDGSAHEIRALTLRLTQLFDLTGHPAISLPCGLTELGLPCGIQLVGRLDHTLDLLAVAAQCERILGEHR